MHIDIYKLERKHDGLQPGNIMMARVELGLAGISVECHDNALKQKLSEIFSFPLGRYEVITGKGGVLTHREEVVPPFTEDFFKEVIFILHRYGLYGDLRG